MTADDRMTALDAAFFHLERAGQRLHVAGVVTIEGTVDFEDFVADLGARLHCIPRYTQRPMSVPFGLSHPTWEDDPQFDVRNHVVRHRLQGAGDEHQLVRVASRLFAHPLNLRRPLWEAHLIEGYRGDHAALMVKVHHSMIDGISGVQLMGVMFDPFPDPAPPAAPTMHDVRRVDPLPLPLQCVWRAARDNAVSSYEILRGLLGQLRRKPTRLLTELGAVLESANSVLQYLLTPVPTAPWNGHVGARRRLEWTTLPLRYIKAVKNRLGGTVNDVVLATISGALRRYLESHRFELDGVELRAACPVNTRSASEHLTLGNRWSAIMVPLPVGIPDPAERYQRVRIATEGLKERGESKHIQRMLDLVTGLPPALQPNLAWVQPDSIPINTICTNVPGPPLSLYVQGKRIEKIVPVVPLMQGVGLAFAVMSYADTLTIGIPCDPALVPDAERIPALLQSAFSELAAVAGLEATGPCGGAGSVGTARLHDSAA